MIETIEATGSSTATFGLLERDSNRADTEERSNGGVEYLTWVSFEAGRAFECPVILCKETDGYSVHAATLPGVTSEGETEEEAIANIREALEAVIEMYLADGSIPWSQSDPTVFRGGEERRIVVNV